MIATLRSPRPLTLIMGVLLALMLVTPVAPAGASNRFTDSDETPFSSQIDWLAERGISTGWKMPDGTWQYRPFEPIQRDAMAAFLYRMSINKHAPSPSHLVFADIRGATFHREILWMADMGISQGWMEGGVRTYRPYEPVKRDAMAAFLYRAAGSPAYTAPRVSPFDDVATNRVFYKEIAWMHSAGISTGWIENGRVEYRPDEPVKRDAMAAFLYRFDHKGYEINLPGGKTPGPSKSLPLPPAPAPKGPPRSGGYQITPDWGHTNDLRPGVDPNDPWPCAYINNGMVGRCP